MNITSKSKWVCGTCGQGLTRKASAKRHNNALHFGLAMVVRPFDYIIGRINREFSINDSSLYRLNKKDNLLPPTYINSAEDNIDFLNKNIRDNTSDQLGIGSEPQQRSDNNKWHRFDTSQRKTDRLQESPDIPPDQLGNLVGRHAKLLEFRILVNKYYHPQKADEILRMIALLDIKGKENYLDENLNWLRKMDRISSNSTNSQK